MATVACFCGYLYSFDGAEGPCPQCGAVASVRTTAIRQVSHDYERSRPDAAEAGASRPERTPLPSRR